MCRLLLINLIILTFCKFILCVNVKRHVNFPFDDSSIHTEYVDTSNLTDLRIRFNLTEEQMKRISTGVTAAKQRAAINNNSTQYFRDIKEYRMNNIVHNILNAFHGGGITSGGLMNGGNGNGSGNSNGNDNSEESPEYPLHEMAAYPKCNAETSESSWLQDNNITMQFAHSLFETRRSNLNLDSAILRLYKINPNGSEESPNSGVVEEAAGKSKRCTDPLLDSQIRVTVSIVQQLRRNKRGTVERKKRICNTIMTNASKTGWIEIDIKRAIYIWESVSKQMQNHQSSRAPVLVGWLMIEVHDEEEQPLKPGLFFKPPNCNQADLAIPWNYYRPRPSMSTSATLEVPRYPRLDVKLTGYASFAPLTNNLNKAKIYDDFKRKLHPTVEEKTSEIDSREVSTFITPTANNHLRDALYETDDDEEQPTHYQYRRHLKVQLPKYIDDDIDNYKHEQHQQQQQQHHHHHHHHHYQAHKAIESQLHHSHHHYPQQHELDTSGEIHSYHHHHNRQKQQQQQQQYYSNNNNNSERITPEKEEEKAKVLKHIEQKRQHQQQLHVEHQHLEQALPSYAT